MNTKILTHSLCVSVGLTGAVFAAGRFQDCQPGCTKEFCVAHCKHYKEVPDGCQQDCRRIGSDQICHSVGCPNNQQ